MSCAQPSDASTSIRDQRGRGLRPMIGFLVIGLLAAVGASIPSSPASASPARAHRPRPVVHLYLSRSKLPAAGGAVTMRLRAIRATRCRFTAPSPVEVATHWIGCRDGLVQVLARFPGNGRAMTVRRHVTAWAYGPGGRAGVVVFVDQAAYVRPRAKPKVKPKPLREPSTSATVPPLTVATTSLPSAAVGINYATNLTATGGTEPYSWAITSGALPRGLTLASDGVIAGTPSQAGPASFVVRVTDSTSPSPKMTKFRLSISVAPKSIPLTITTSTLAGATVGVGYTATLSATGGTAPYSWAIVSGSLPAGLNLSSGGVISGTPSSPDSADVVAQVTDSTAPTPLVTTATLSLAVLPAPFSGTISQNWSGYVVPSTSALVTEASGSWTVPTFDCSTTPNASAATWVGIGGMPWSSGGSSGVLLQTGIVTSCTNGVQSNTGVWEEYPSSPNSDFSFTDFPVSPGDVIDASIYQGTSGQWETKVDDLTTGLSGVMVTGGGWGVASDGGGGTFTEQGSTSSLSYSGGYTAEWIVEDFRQGPSASLVPFADYGTVTFSGITTSLASWSLTPDEEVEIAQSGTVLSTPSPPSGDGFSVSYTA